MTDKIVVLSTCASVDEAERLARVLLTARLAACVNVVPQVRSFYWWQNAIESAGEYLLIVKTSRQLLDRVRAALEAAHSYELPEVLALLILDASPNYLNWMDQELGS